MLEGISLRPPKPKKFKTEIQKCLILFMHSVFSTYLIGVSVLSKVQTFFISQGLFCLSWSGPALLFTHRPVQVPQEDRSCWWYSMKREEVWEWRWRTLNTGGRQENCLLAAAGWITGKMSGMLRKHRFVFLGTRREGNGENSRKQRADPPPPLQHRITDRPFTYLAIETIILFPEEKYKSCTKNHTPHCQRPDVSGTLAVQREKNKQWWSASLQMPVLACVEFDSNNKNKWGREKWRGGTGELVEILKKKKGFGAVKGMCSYAASRTLC